jgi:hypothetical protein
MGSAKEKLKVFGHLAECPVSLKTMMAGQFADRGFRPIGSRAKHPPGSIMRVRMRPKSLICDIGEVGRRAKHPTRVLGSILRGPIPEIAELCDLAVGLNHSNG